MSPSGTGEAAGAFERSLGPGGWSFPITAIDDVGVPVWAIWHDAAGLAAGGIGYGASEVAARTGALGETVEQVAGVRALRDATPVTGSRSELAAARGPDAVADPRLLGLPAGAEYDDERPLRWLPMTRRRDGAEVLVPVEFVASGGQELPTGPGPEPIAVPVSNGKGAGTSLGQAVRHAVLEILQRDGNGLTFRALDRGTVIDLHGVRDPATREALDRLRGAGVEVVAKLAGTDLGLPNVVVVGAAPGDDVLRATACGEAVDPDREVAVRKAVLEFASARARKAFMHGPLDAVDAVAPAGYLAAALAGVDPARDERRVLDAMLGWLRMPQSRWRPLLEERVLAERARVPFTSLPTGAGDPVAQLEDAGFDVLVRDLSPGDGVHAVKVVVPGTEVETVAYGRIGERNVQRLLDRGRDDLVRVGDDPGGWQRVHLTAEAVERLGGPAWLDRAALDAVAGDLFPLYREPARHAAPVVLGGTR